MPSRVSDAIKPHKHHLDFTSLKELPESHAWTSPDSPSSTTNSSVSESVPIIDLEDPKAQELVGLACKTWGASSRRLEPPDGVSGYGVARISSFFSKLMWSEGFTIFGSPLEHARQLWPHGYNHFCGIIEDYEKELRKLAGRLMWLILESLGISQEDVEWAGPNKEAGAAIQLNSYPACPDPDRAMGLAAHTDSTLLTILYQNNTSGLQVARDGFGWVTVPPIPWCPGGKHRGPPPHTIQRVVPKCAPQGRGEPDATSPLGGLPLWPTIQCSNLTALKTSGPGQPASYRPVTWTEYLGTKAKHFNEALSSVRLCIPRNGLIDQSNLENRMEII
ncbi:hypothetical protein Vadar_034529 [Vaccinium darrowii]|uniref:Uncharacterized protein n=1 Tax=Vaccinium darrowii TaxID=229202 RepID=A0ACB7Z140_9ERIC|nr:hypothetical protein Vadar_034529 [Vaccinium darrowii]